MAKFTYRRIQRRIPGHPRTALPTSVEDRIWREVERAAKTFQCSRAFVVATALADEFGIDLEKGDRFDTKPAHLSTKAK